MKIPMAAQFEQAIDAQEQMQQETAKQLAGRMKKKSVGGGQRRAVQVRRRQ